MSRQLKLLSLAATAAIALVALLASFAQAATPEKGYERFAGCPTKAEASWVAGCIFAEISGGHFQMGNKDVPISNPITMSGGVDENLGNFVANSEGGLKHVKQQVPGGVIGLTGLDWLVNFLGVEALKLYAVTEAVGQPTVGAQALSLPIRVHLINPVLGSSCYVGSPSSPINLNLTTGTTNPPPPNEPLTGTEAQFGIDFATEVISFSGGTFVDNAFAAPGANGCKLVLFGFIPISINGLVNTASGLPAAAGTNETVQDIDIELAPLHRVYP